LATVATGAEKANKKSKKTCWTTRSLWGYQKTVLLKTHVESITKGGKGE